MQDLSKKIEQHHAQRSDAVDDCNTLLRPADSNGIIILKLKRKFQYSGQVYSESVRPNFILRFFKYLKLNNPLYNDIEVYF